MQQLNIAVVGSGISGLASAWLLSKRHDVTLFEADNRPGGHSNTIDISTPDGIVPVDTGFIVYNEVTYPNLTALFDYLAVDTQRSCMSFAVSLDAGQYEYSGTGLAGLFGQPANLLRPSHYRLAADILRFFREVSALDGSARDSVISLGDWLRQAGYSEQFIDAHILPMGAAIWSVPAEQMLDFPMSAFARFFCNHGLLQVRNRPKWRTVVGGSRNYVGRLLEDFEGTFKLRHPISDVRRVDGGVDINSEDGITQRFDACVLACHADQALRMLADADSAEQHTLSAFRYSDNKAVLHRDEALMPKRKRLWSSWNYVASNASSMPGVTYWMNSLQPLSTGENYFVSLNPDRPIDPGKIAKTLHYRHPVFDLNAMAKQSELWGLQGRRRTWFAGSYFGYGFHEDGLQAGLAVAEELGGIRRPWNVTGESDRLTLPQERQHSALLEAAQ